MKKFKEIIQKEELFCGETDKTGKFTLDTLKNMSEKMEKHIEEDKILSEKEVTKIENFINKHMDFWSRFLNVGEYNKQTKRVKSNLIIKDNQIPVLRGTSEDHKEAINPFIGPDFRPIMGAIAGPNIGLSEIGSIIVRKIADNADKGFVAKSRGGSSK